MTARQSANVLAGVRSHGDWPMCREGRPQCHSALLRVYQHRSCTGLLNKDCIKTLQPTMSPGGLLSKVDSQDTSPPKNRRHVEEQTHWHVLGPGRGNPLPFNGRWREWQPYHIRALNPSPRSCRFHKG